MRVGLSTTTVEQAAKGGIADGIAHYTSDLRSGLVAVGDDVRGYAFDGRLRASGKALVDSEPILGGFAARAGLGIVSGGHMPRFNPPVDIFHVTDFKVIPTKCPCVATLWDAIPLSHPQWLSASARLLAPLVLKRVAHFATRVICATEFAAGEVVRHFRIPSERISIVPWAISDHWFEPVDPDSVARTLAKHGLAPGYIFTVGTIQPRKNVRGLLDAFLRLPLDLQRLHPLVIAGRFGWGDELRARLLDAQMRSPVRWLQDVSDEEVRHLHSAAHVFCFPSLHEGFGIPLLEAFACGVPAICSNTTSLPELSRGAALEIDPLSTDQLVDAIVELLSSETIRIRLKISGRQRLEEFRMSRAVQRTREVYEAALGR